MAEDENKTECPTCPTCQSCTKWKVGFIMCLICSLIMFIMCIVLWVKRNAIHDAVYSRVSKYTGDKVRRSGRNSGGEFVQGMTGGSDFY